MVAAIFEFDVIDAQAHIGRLPGYVRYSFSAVDLASCLDREGARFALASSASSTTVGQGYGTNEIFATAG